MVRNHVFFVICYPKERVHNSYFPTMPDTFINTGLDLKSYAGRTVEVKGNIKYYPQYGHEIILDKPTDIKVVKYHPQ